MKSEVDNRTEQTKRMTFELGVIAVMAVPISTAIYLSSHLFFWVE
jgi:hypothetical protein